MMAHIENRLVNDVVWINVSMDDKIQWSILMDSKGFGVELYK